jgi:predicted branched-subunit amino acid permease
MTKFDPQSGPPPGPASARPHLTIAGLRFGVIAILPTLPGVTAFSMVVGATCARKGLSLVDCMLMNGVVYAGFSQLVALEAWPSHITLAGLLSLALIAVTVNARMLLMSASLRPWLGPLPAWQAYPMLFLTADIAWIVAMRYRAEGGRDIGMFLGSSIVIWLLWMAATTLGYLFGMLISDPRAIGLDLVMPVFFGTMLVPLWRGRSRALAWVVAGVVAFAVQYLFGGWWFIAAGALAGAAVEGWRK